MHGLFSGGSALAHPLPVFLRLSTEGEVMDTIWTPADAAADCTTLSEAAFGVGYWEDTRQPFVPKAIWALGRDGGCGVGCPATYSLDVHRPDGTVIRIRRPWTKIVLSDEARDWLPGQAGLPVVPRELPVYSRIILPGDGRVWVWPNQSFEKVPFGTTHRWAFPSTGSFDVFLEDGVWLATVRLPEGARFNGYPTEPDIHIRGDTIWAVSQDSLGVQAPVRYEVSGLSRSSR
jgi:hypothetical protein